MAQDVIQFENEITRVARAIFAWRYPRAGWDENLFRGEREDCELLAAQFREIFLLGHRAEHVHLWTIPSGHDINETWRQAFVATKFAEVLSELAAGVDLKALDASDRAWVREQAEITVEAAIDRFQRPVKDDGSQYQPEREYDPSEVDFDGRTEQEQAS